MAHVDYGYLLRDPTYQNHVAFCKSLNVGDKIKFWTEKRSYVIKAKSERYLICTKAFNLQNTVLYTILDLERFVRGRNDRVFNPYDYTKQEDIDKCLNDLVSGGISVSHRHCVVIDVVA